MKTPTNPKGSGRKRTCTCGECRKCRNLQSVRKYQASLKDRQVTQRPPAPVKAYSWDRTAKGGPASANA